MSSSLIMNMVSERYSHVSWKLPCFTSPQPLFHLADKPPTIPKHLVHVPCTSTAPHRCRLTLQNHSLTSSVHQIHSPSSYASPDLANTLPCPRHILCFTWSSRHHLWLYLSISPSPPAPFKALTDLQKLYRTDRHRSMPLLCLQPSSVVRIYSCFGILCSR